MSNAVHTQDCRTDHSLCIGTSHRIPTVIVVVITANSQNILETFWNITTSPVLLSLCNTMQRMSPHCAKLRNALCRLIYHLVWGICSWSSCSYGVARCVLHVAEQIGACGVMGLVLHVLRSRYSCLPTRLMRPLLFFAREWRINEKCMCLPTEKSTHSFILFPHKCMPISMSQIKLSIYPKSSVWLNGIYPNFPDT